MELYPEKRPDEVKPVETFVFSTQAIPFSKQDTEWQIEALESKINKYIDKCQLTYQGHPFPVIEHILKISDDEKELGDVGKALIKIAPLVSVLHKLKKRQQVIDLAEEDPNWFMWAFANVDAEIDTGLIAILDDDSTTTED